MRVAARITGAGAVAAVLLVGPPLAAAAPTPPEPYLSELSIPTNMAFAPDGRLFFTEKSTGQIRIVRDGELLATPFATLSVVGDAERGLLGVALDPHFEARPWVYVYFTDAADGRNRLIRIEANGDVGGTRQMLLDLLDASSGIHNGGELAFGGDGLLYITVGETGNRALAQDPAQLGGKILRLEPDGSIPPTNPFGPSGIPNEVWTEGNRNSFGLCVDPATGELWETENGPDVNDEINLLIGGANYGWPLVTGRVNQEGLNDPVVVFADTVALTGCAVVNGDVYFGSYNDGWLRVLRSGGHESGDVENVFRFPTGVLDVQVGPDGQLWIATTDAIWRMSFRPRDPGRTCRVDGCGGWLPWQGASSLPQRSVPASCVDAGAGLALGTFEISDRGGPSHRRLDLGHRHQLPAVLPERVQYLPRVVLQERSHEVLPRGHDAASSSSRRFVVLMQTPMMTSSPPSTPMR
jgi:glucose/arabinose dehydrogenase